MGTYRKRKGKKGKKIEKGKLIMFIQSERTTVISMGYEAIERMCFYRTKKMLENVVIESKEQCLSGLVGTTTGEYIGVDELRRAIGIIDGLLNNVYWVNEPMQD